MINKDELDAMGTDLIKVLPGLQVLSNYLDLLHTTYGTKVDGVPTNDELFSLWATLFNDGTIDIFDRLISNAAKTVGDVSTNLMNNEVE